MIDEMTENAMEIGQEQAARILQIREQAKERRINALNSHVIKLQARMKTLDFDEGVISSSVPPQSVGVLVAEGDSWFDYPLHDILKILEDQYGYEVESVARKGDPIEEMAYGDGQLEDFTRRIEKLLRRNSIPKAILFSGGGNDIAGKEFGMLLNHARSALPNLNDQVVSGVIEQRIKSAYITILSAVTGICKQTLGSAIPILVHGYDYPVPDGRGFMGGWWILPGPWLEPGFREKGFKDLQHCKDLTRYLIDRFNEMLRQVTTLDPFKHVRYLDLRKTLLSDQDYKQWWANELHPTLEGFKRVTDRFLIELESLP